MSDGLTVWGGGSTRVATDELIEEVGRLGNTGARCSLLGERADSLSAMLERTGEYFGRARHELFMAGYQLEQSARVAGGLSTSLLQAAERYGATERQLLAIDAIAGQFAAWSLGFGVRLSLPVLLVAAEGVAVGEAVRSILGGGTDGEAALDEDALRSLLSTPGVAEALGISLDSMDEFVMGLAGVPLPVAQLAGSGMQAPDNAAVLLGTAGAMGAVTGGFLVEREVTVRRTDGLGAASGADAGRGAPAGRQVNAPASLAELAERVPHGGDGDPQVRIERYADGDATKWIVYVAGTVDFTLEGGTQPNDMRSNLHVVAERSPLDDAALFGPDHGAGERAVRQALAEAGVQPGDEIAGVGYSGGGAIIGNLMRDPELNMVAGVNLGGPARVEAGASLLNIEHANDPVPSTGGAGHPIGPVTVEREVDLRVEPSDLLAPAHDLDAYRRTAALADECDDPRVVGVRTSFAEFAGGLMGTETMWVAERAERPPSHRAIEPPLPAEPATAPNFAAG